MKLFLKELKFNRKALIIWSICISLLIAVAVGKEFAMTQSGGESINEVMNAFPKSVKIVFGMGDFDLSKIDGYFVMMATYIFISVAIHAGLLGANILTKEETDKTFEFLNTKPISRSKIVTYKFLAVLVNIIVLNIVSLIVSIMSVRTASPEVNIDAKIVELMVGMLFIQLFFATLGMFISAIAKKSKMGTPITAGIILITFFLGKFIELNGKVNFLKVLVPFDYFNAEVIVFKGGIQAKFLALSIMLTAIFLIGTYGFYKRKDLNI